MSDLLTDAEAEYLVALLEGRALTSIDVINVERLFDFGAVVKTAYGPALSGVGEMLARYARREKTQQARIDKLLG